MNKIETLLKELCPNGVELEEIGKIIDYEQPTKYLVSSKEYNDNYELPVLTAGQTFILGYTNETEGIYQASKENPVIIFDDFTTSKKWVDFNFKIKSTAMKILKVKSGVSNILIRYVWHYLGTITYSPDQHGRQWISTYSKFKIPIPPLEIQEEIVKILDKFTDYVTELTTELTLRQKQYNYYRDKLLSFEEEVQIKKLSELATIKARIGWQGLTKKEYLETGEYYLVTGTDFVKGTVNFNTCHFVEEKRFFQDKNIQLKEEDVLVTKDGTLGKVAYITNLPGPTTLNSGVFVVRKNSDEILSRYLYHYLNSPYLMNFAQSKLTGGTIKHLNQNVIVELPIPIPDLDKQKEIIYILDSFNSIVNNLENGLPKEIELRQKQYEYYRDKLLTFD